MIVALKPFRISRIDIHACTILVPVASLPVCTSRSEHAYTCFSSECHIGVATIPEYHHALSSSVLKHAWLEDFKAVRHDRDHFRPADTVELSTVHPPKKFFDVDPYL